MEGQFNKIDLAYTDYLGESYDYFSVMHYDSRAFSKNGLNTIEAVKPGMTQVLGKALDLSEVDLRKVNNDGFKFIEKCLRTVQFLSRLINFMNAKRRNLDQILLLQPKGQTFHFHRRNLVSDKKSTNSYLIINRSILF